MNEHNFNKSVSDLFDDSSFFHNLNDSLSRSCYQESSLSNLNVSALCCNNEHLGFDKNTGSTWIYPTNFPVRDYQYNIIQAALLKNTLVSLPTGLGKTFIAAVIMYNFYRWYPLGKIIFTAPTRPLVAQQIEACYNIIAIPSEDTVEMTGSMQVNIRKLNWKQKRVIFATPQVIYNDLKTGVCPHNLIRCLVFDEAHRARGNYAYCQIISTLTDMGHSLYRVVALSATPGSKVEDVIKVVKSLQISHLELRTESCIDVAPYSHSKKINTVVIQLGDELTHWRQLFVDILDVYARRLKQLNVLPNNIGNLSKGRIVLLYKEYQTKERNTRHPQHNYIVQDLSLLIALFHGLELLVKHGTRVFLNFFDEHPEKSWIQADDKLTSLLERLRDHLGVNPKEVDTSVLPDGTIGEVPPNISFGHPKFEKLREIIMEHFTQAQARQDETKAIVFCEFRESVNLVNCLLLQCRPLIKPQMFVGQGATGSKATVSQKQQLHIMRSFREGGCNTLVATCVAEEGLDVGNVDIIICFDISTRSPVRLVQRCGRTGRKRGGQVYILVTEGREHQTLVECMHSRDTLNKRIMQSREVHKCLYEKNQRMLPPDVTPKCHKMHITVPSKVETKKKVRDIRDMITSRPSTSGTSSVRQSECSSDVLSKEEYESLFPNGFQVEIQFNDGEQLWNCSKEFLLNEEIKHVYASNNINLSSWIEWQRRLQDTVNVSHSTDSRILTELLQYADAKRFQLPSTTEIPEIGTQLFNTQSLTVQKEQKKKPAPKKKSRQSPTKNYGDIRALFNSGVKSTKEYTKVVYELGLMRDNTLPTSLIDIMVDLTINDPIKTDRRCLTCDIIGSNCDKYFKKKPTETFKFDSDLALPDVELISNLRDFTLDKSPSNSNTLLDDYIIEDKVFPIIDTNIPNSVIKRQECDVTVTNDVENNFNLEFDFDEDDVIEKSQNNDKTVCTQINFDLGDIDEIFNETQLSNKVQDNDNGNTSNPKETLEFFGLDSIEDIFADSSKEKTPQEEEILFPNSKGIVDDNRQVESKSDTVNRPFSPSLLSSFHTDDDIICSPILCSQKKSHARMNFSTPNNRNQIRKPIAGRISDLFHEIDLTNDLDQDSNRKANDTVEQSAFTKIENKEDVSTNKTTDMSMFTITQIVDIINKSSKPNTSSKNGDSANEIIFDNFVCSNADEISSSPILMTPTEKKKIEDKNNSKVGISSSNKSLIILSSSDESNDETIINDDISNNVVFGKRKLDEDDSSLSSPYFAKKPKLFFKCTGNTSQSIKDKLKLALRKSVKSSQQTNIIITSQKENISHVVTNFDSDDDFNDVFDTPIKKSQNIKSLDILKKFKRDRKDSILISTQNNITHNTNSHNDNSEDEFVIKSPIKCMRDNTLNKSFDLNPTQTSTVNHKVRKKARVKKQCEFIDYEAEDSDSDGHDNTWCTQDSELAGSIVDFICDDDDINNEDIYVHYLQSIKDQPRGMFKIPDLPKKSVNVLSQQLLSDDEQDYEMDSFCVDSNIGLTQVDDLSELEIAERILKDKRKKKPRNNRVKDSNDTSDSFNVISKKKNVRRISSDSDD